jgi:prepilin-type processing-associated H-X9-DG protein
MPVPESLVRVPSDMYAMADGYLASLSGQVENGLGIITVQYGMLGDPQHAEKSLAAAKKRHRGKLNAVFCDSHVESMALNDFLFPKTESDERRWNNDHGPFRYAAE